MSSIEDGATVDEVVPSGQVSYVDLLRADVADLAAQVDVYIPVVGYEQSNLAVQYRLPENGKELDGIARKVLREFAKKQWEQNLYTAIDTMIALCLGLYVKPEGVEEYVPLDPDGAGEPVRFDHRLAPLIGIAESENATARQVVRKVFGNNDIMLLSHTEKLNRWLTNTKADLETEIWELGEL